jgi:DNA-binding NtrC family response regulator
MTILLLDDDETFRTALSELLRDDGHTVQAYGSIAEMPELSELPAPAALITDHQLGGEDGLGFARRFNAVHPDVPIILVTAYATEYLTQEAAALPYLSLLRKPLPYDDLHQILHAQVSAGSQR